MVSVAETIRAMHDYQARKEGACIWGQKTPRFIRERGLIERAFPDARWVLIYRDPRAVVASMLASKQHTYSVWHACARWNRDNQDIASMVRGGDVPSNVTLVCYERLIEHFQSEAERVFRFVGVEPIDRATIERNARPVFFARSRFPINTVREGVVPSPEKIQAWRRQLATEQIERIETQCSELMDALGYRRETSGQASVTVRWAERLRDLGILYQYLTRWPEYPVVTLLRKLIMACSRMRRRGHQCD